MSGVHALLEPIRALHDRIRSAVVDACTRQSSESLAAVDAEEASDTIYRIDRISEDILIDGLATVAESAPLCIMAEGLSGGTIALPGGIGEGICRWRILVDPIDGTRGIMYQKRSAWILTGVAPNRGAATRLSDITLAVQTEIPLVKQHLSDQLWAVRGEGAAACRFNRITGDASRWLLRPSRAATFAHGFAERQPLFPRRERRAGGDRRRGRHATCLVIRHAGKAACFEDQYLSDGRPVVRADGRSRSIHRRYSSARGKSSGRARVAPRAVLPSIRPVFGLDCHGARRRTHGTQRWRARRAVRPRYKCRMGGLREPNASSVAGAGVARRVTASPAAPRVAVAVVMRVRRLSEIRAQGEVRWFQPALDRLAWLSSDPDRIAQQFFDSKNPLYVARAPGRLDVMGGIADYSGATVLQLPLDRSTTAIVQRQQEPRFDLATRRGDGGASSPAAPRHWCPESCASRGASRHGSRHVRTMLGRRTSSASSSAARTVRRSHPAVTVRVCAF